MNHLRPSFNGKLGNSLEHILRLMTVVQIDRCLWALIMTFAFVAAAPDATAEEAQGHGDSTSPDQGARRCKGAAVNLNFVDAELLDVINFVSKTTGRRFMVAGPPPAVKLTVVSPRPICPNEVYSVFLSVLAANGLTVVKRGRFLEVVSTDRAVKSPIPIVIER